MCFETLVATYVNCYVNILQGYMIVYDVTDRKSFDSVKDWIKRIKQVSNEVIIIKQCVL